MVFLASFPVSSDPLAGLRPSRAYDIQRGCRFNIGEVTKSLTFRPWRRSP